MGRKPQLTKMKCIKCGGDSFYFSNWQDERDQINFRCSHCLTVNQKPPELPIDFADSEEDEIKFDRECKIIVYFRYDSNELSDGAITDLIRYRIEGEGFGEIIDMEIK